MNCLQAGGGGRCLLHGERPGAEEPRATRPEHGRDLGAEEVMEDGDRTSRTDRPTDPASGGGADLGGRRRWPAEAGGGPEGPKIQNWEKKSSNTLGLPEQLHLERLYQVTHRASLKTAATSSHCVQFNRNTSKLLETVLEGAKGVDNVSEMAG